MKHIIAKGIYYDALYSALVQTNWYDLLEENISIALSDYLSDHTEPMAEGRDESYALFYSMLDEFYNGTLEMLRKISDGCLALENDEMYK